MEKKRKKGKMRAVVLVLCMFLTAVLEMRNPVTVEAAKDKTKPMAIVYLNKTAYTRGSIYVQVYASDKSGIKSILIKKGNISKTASKYWKARAISQRQKRKR